MRFLTLTLAIVLGYSPLAAKDDKAKNADRLDDAATLFSEIMGTPDKSIPQDLLNKSHCIVLVPGLKKGAIGFGGKYGRGFSLCRAQSGEGWGPPAAIRIEGGSFGFQLGFSSSDVVLLIMNERGMKKLTSSKFTLGGRGHRRRGSSRTQRHRADRRFHDGGDSSWSRSKGLFAGISLDGATLRNDIDENQIMYGQRWDSKQILTSGAKPPATAAKLLAVLNKYSSRRAS